MAIKQRFFPIKPHYDSQWISCRFSRKVIAIFMFRCTVFVISVGGTGSHTYKSKHSIRTQNAPPCSYSSHFLSYFQVLWLQIETCRRRRRPYTLQNTLQNTYPHTGMWRLNLNSNDSGIHKKVRLMFVRSPRTPPSLSSATPINRIPGISNQSGKHIYVSRLRSIQDLWLSHGFTMGAMRESKIWPTKMVWITKAKATNGRSERANERKKPHDRISRYGNASLKST